VRKILSLAAAVAASGLGSPAIAADLWLDSDHTAYGGDYSTGNQPDLLDRRGERAGFGVDDRRQRNPPPGRARRLGLWPGRAVRINDNSHTVDNSGTKDFVLFQFDRVVELDMAQFNTGWHNMNDTDATIGFDSNNMGWASPPNWRD
jgi:hypothetical protein